VIQDSKPLPTLETTKRDGSTSSVDDSLFYTVDEIANMWKVSQDSVRRIFRCEPGVLSISPRQRKGKRPYATLRIPQPVLERVRRRLSLVKY
jgi:hypothetical protein